MEADLESMRTWDEVIAALLGEVMTAAEGDEEDADGGK